MFEWYAQHEKSVLNRKYLSSNRLIKNNCMKSSIFRFCLLVYISLFCVACSHSEKLSGNEFLIEGKISGVEDGVVIDLLRWDDNTGMRIASDTLRNGRFILKEEVETATERMTISPRGDGFPSMFLYVWGSPKAKVKIEGKGKLFPLWEVKSPVSYQKEENLYKSKSKDIIAEEAHISIEKGKAFSKIMAASSRDEALPYMKIVDSLDVINDALRIKRIFADIGIMEKTEISTTWFDKMRVISYEVKPSYADKEHYNELRKRVEALYFKMSEEDKTTPQGYRITAYLFPPPVVGIGDDIVDTDLIDKNGNTTKISDYLGKYLLLDFWSLSCGPCIMSLPEMKEISEIYSEKLTIISISLDTKSRWELATNTYDMPWINIRDPKSYGGLAANYGVNGIPSYVMISPEGKVIDKWGGFGEGNLKRKVNKNIKSE